LLLEHHIVSLATFSSNYIEINGVLGFQCDSCE